MRNHRHTIPTVKTYEPLNTLKPVAQNIWIVDGPIEHMQQFGLSVPFPTRMTVIRLANNELFIHSPTKPDERLCLELEKIGKVSHLVSPNKIHYASINLWSKRYPKAVCWASPRVRKRAQSRNIKVVFDRDLGNSAEEPWAGEIDQHIFRGSRFMDEVIFFHKSSSTLILADLIENFEPSKVSRALGWALRLAGNLDPDGKLPVVLGIDEHFFSRKQRFATTFCDLKKRRIFDVAPGRSNADLADYLQQLPNRQRVKVICMDLSETCRTIDPQLKGVHGLTRLLQKHARNLTEWQRQKLKNLSGGTASHCADLPLQGGIDGPADQKEADKRPMPCAGS